ncbi:MAG TPA: amidase family protein, partial [Gemmatimonadaceae bacterium]|nr:amidase family protein [Gemmatimonadaceae bacterium]
TAQRARMRLAPLALLIGLSTRLTAQQPAPSRPPFDVTETSIADIHAAMRAGTLTCRELVTGYLERIAAYDRNGPALNSLIVVNPAALAVADSLDRRARGGRLAGALHCIPIIVKDNFETNDLPTTAGSLSLEGMRPARDAFMVRRIREAGAIVLAKSNMAEFAFTPFETVSSILPGYTKNPYALDRVTAGSSGGSAAAVAASLGEAALGTDTGNSIRGPSAHQALVGIRSTMGLTSRDGVAPLNLASDIAGPMARTVADAVAIFQVVAGEDAADTVTARSRGRRAADYTTSLKRDALRGARIGVLRQAYERPGTDPEVVRVFTAAVDDMRRQGAVVVDSAMVAGLDERLRALTGSCNQFKFDLEAWLARQGDRAPVHTVAEILKSRRFHPTIQPRLEAAQAESLPPARNPGCRDRDEFRAWLRTAVTGMMDSLRLDALVYPTWSNPPRLIGDLNTPAGDNSQLFSPSTGFPAITVPMGYTRGQLPAGVTLFGRAWSEPTLIALAYSYEHATRHRRPPASAPPLR